MLLGLQIDVHQTLLNLIKTDRRVPFVMCYHALDQAVQFNGNLVIVVAEALSSAATSHMRRLSPCEASVQDLAESDNDVA